MIIHPSRAFLPLLLVLFSFSSLVAQNSFKPEMMKLNPVQNDNEIGTASSIKTHDTFLQNAIETQNELHQLYGLIYLHKDYFKQTDFVTASKYLLEAEKLAKKSEKPGWIGIVNGYRAALTSVTEDNPDLTIKNLNRLLPIVPKPTIPFVSEKVMNRSVTNIIILAITKKRIIILN